MLFACIMSTFLPLIFKMLFVFMVIYCLFQVLFCIMHSAFNLMVIHILCQHCIFSMEGLCALLRNSAKNWPLLLLLLISMFRQQAAFIRNALIKRYKFIATHICVTLFECSWWRQLAVEIQRLCYMQRFCFIYICMHISCSANNIQNIYAKLVKQNKCKKCYW